MIQEELIDLAREVVKRAPVEAIILKRDTDFPGPHAMAAEMEKLARIRG